MRYSLDSKETKSMDYYTSRVIGIPSLVLMERAAYEVAALVNKHIKKTDRILVVCGPGNNGGDGIAAGRILFLQGYTVAVLLMSGDNKCTSQTALQLEIAKNLGIPIETSNKLHEYNIIIDSIFGVGLTRPVTGEYEAIIDEINRTESKVFSVDIPSGISADTGAIMNTAVKADYTITFGTIKHGLLLYPGAEYAGTVTVADIGFPEAALMQAKPDTFYYEPEDLKRLPVRKSYSNKGTYGKVLVIAGSKGISGAAYLSAKAAYRTGAGLVKILTSGENREILQTLLPEALFAAYDVNEGDIWKTEVLSSLNWATTIVLGPGLGMTLRAQELVTLVLENAGVPLVVDADALNLLSKKLDAVTMETPERLKQLEELLPEGTILTPHLKELSRLMGSTVTDIADNIIDTANQCSYNSKLVYVIKDARTIVTSNGRKYINISGNNGMATGGCGDVLTGIIGALISQGMAPYEASCLAVYIHGLAGDLACREKGPYSLMAGDLIDYIEKVLNFMQ